MEDRQSSLMLALAAILVALLLIIRLVDDPAEEDDAEEADLLALDGAEVVALGVVGDAGLLHAERTAEGWILTEPLPARGDDDKLDALVSALDRLRAGPPIEGADPARYGLDAPRAAVTLTLADGRAHRVLVGMKAPVGFKTYVQVDDGGVQVASGDLGASVVLPPESFRDARVLYLDEDDPSGLAWTSDRYAWRLERRDEGWFLADGRRADARAVGLLLDALAGLRFEGFFDELGPEEAGLDAPRARLLVQGAPGERALEVGGERAGGVLVRSPSGVLGTVAGIDELDLSVVELLEPRLVPAAPAELVALELSLDGREARFNLEDGVWTRDGEALPDRGQALIEALASAEADRAARFEDLGPLSGRIVARTAEGSFTLELGSVDAEGRRAAEPGGQVLRVPAATIEALASLLD